MLIFSYPSRCSLKHFVGGYAGTSSTLSLNGSYNQYVSMTNPYHNLSYCSLTVEARIYPKDLTSNRDSLLFSQCSTLSSSLCLLCMFRCAKVFMSSYYNNCVGTAVIFINERHCAAYVHDYSKRDHKASIWMATKKVSITHLHLIKAFQVR